MSSELHTLRKLKAERTKLRVDLESTKQRLNDLEIDFTAKELYKLQKDSAKAIQVRDKVLNRLGYESVRLAVASMKVVKQGYEIQAANIERMQLSIKKLEKTIKTSEKAKELLQGAAEAKEFEIRSKVEELVTRGLRAVFDRSDYRFVMDLSIKRNRLALDYYWEEELDGEVIKIKIHNQSGGIIDVTVMLLRVVFLSLFEDCSRFLALDEPFKHLSKEFSDPVAILLKKLQKIMKLQIILITHNEVLAECGDTIYEVYKNCGRSVIRKIS